VGFYFGDGWLAADDESGRSGICMQWRDA